MPSALILTATRLCAWTRRLHQSRLVPFTFLVTRPGRTNLKGRSCHFPTVGMTTKLTPYRKACNERSSPDLWAQSNVRGQAVLSQDERGPRSDIKCCPLSA